jgi:hypothetical protein
MFPETYITDRDMSIARRAFRKSLSKARRANRHGKRYDMPVKKFPVVRNNTNE